MKSTECFPFLGAAIFLVVLISQVSAGPKPELFRVRREADPSFKTEPEAGTTMSSTMMPESSTSNGTASDITGRVKRGMDSVSNQKQTGSSRSKNGTPGSDTDCEAKDGKCTIDVLNDGNSSLQSNSDESNQSPMPSTTNSAGYRNLRQKRLTNCTNRYNYTYPSSGLYSGTGLQYGARPYSSESDEYIWKRATDIQGI